MFLNDFNKIKKTDIKNILNIKFKTRTINCFKYTKKNVWKLGS